MEECHSRHARLQFSLLVDIAIRSSIGRAALAAVVIGRIVSIGIVVASVLSQVSKRPGSHREGRQMELL
jgi:hypothetical protein